MRKQTDYIVIHCAATTPKMNIDIKTIEKWHKDRGFLSVGYHYVIKRDGTRQPGRPINEVGAHVVGYNHKSVGVCMVGGVAGTCAHCGKETKEIKVEPWPQLYCVVCGVAHPGQPESNFTKEQWATLLITLQELHEEFPSAVIVGHRDLDAGKACPSFNVSEYLDDKPDLTPHV